MSIAATTSLSSLQQQRALRLLTSAAGSFEAGGQASKVGSSKAGSAGQSLPVGSTAPSYPAASLGGLLGVQEQAGAQAGAQAGTQAGSASGSVSLSDALFADTDQDGSGSLSASEFSAEVAKLEGASGGSQGLDASSLFARIDQDHDGSISADELTQALRHGHHRHGTENTGTDTANAATASETTGTSLSASADAEPASGLASLGSSLLSGAASAYRTLAPVAQTAALSMVL